MSTYLDRKRSAEDLVHPRARSIKPNPTGEIQRLDDVVDGLASALAFAQEEKAATDRDTGATPTEAESPAGEPTESPEQTTQTVRRTTIPAPHVPIPRPSETVGEEKAGTAQSPAHQVAITVDPGTGPIDASDAAGGTPDQSDAADEQLSPIESTDPSGVPESADPPVDTADATTDRQPQSGSTDSGDAQSVDAADAEAPSIEELKRAQQEALKDELRRLQTAQKEVTSERTQLQRRSEDALAAINADRLKLRQLTFPDPEELDETRQRLNALENERDRLQLELLNARARRDQDMRAMEARRAARESELRTAIEQTQAELAELATTKSKLVSERPTKDLGELETHLESLSTQVREAQEEIRRRREAIHAVTESREESRQLKELIAKGTSELARLQIVLSELVTSEDSSGELSELDGQLQRQAEELQEVQAQFEEVEARRQFEATSVEPTSEVAAGQKIDAESSQASPHNEQLRERHAVDSEQSGNSVATDNNVAVSPVENVPASDLHSVPERPDFVLPQSRSLHLRFEPEAEPEELESGPDEDLAEPADESFRGDGRLPQPPGSQPRFTTRQRMVLLTFGLSCLFCAYGAIAASFAEQLVSLLRANGAKPNAFADLMSQGRFWIAGSLLLGHLICGARPKRIGAKFEYRAAAATGLAAVGITLWHWSAQPGWFWPVITVLSLLHVHFLLSYLAELCAFGHFARVERYCDTLIASTTIGAVLFLAIGIGMMVGITAGMHYFGLAIASILLVGLTLLIPQIAIEIVAAVQKGRWTRS